MGNKEFCLTEIRLRHLILCPVVKSGELHKKST